MGSVNPSGLSVNAGTVIAAATGASTGSDEFYVPEGGHTTVFCDALGAGETVGLEMKRPDGTFIALAAGFLTSTVNADTIVAKGIYRCTKSVTASATGVYSYDISFKRKGY